MPPLSNPVDDLFATLIGRLEDDPGLDVQAFLNEHPVHASALRSRLERLRRVGLVGDQRGESTLVAAMRERFGVHSELPLRAEGDSRVALSYQELLPSRVVGGRYRILSEIGRGGMGRVFRAFDLDLGRDVALKVADLERLLPVAGDEQRRAWIERFLAEARVTAQLEHPSIVPVHDVGLDHAGQLYYTMKVVEGETLEQKIRQWHDASSRGSPIPTPELVRIVIQVCQAVAFAHERGVLHRDLKPSNVMVGRFGEVQVMDWGLAKLIAAAESQLIRPAAAPMPASQTLAGEVMGTPTHMAPEQARGDPKAIGRSVDVFGIGALLHHGLHGVPPNRDGAPPPSPSDHGVAAELAAICRRALHASPQLRYESARALADDLQAYLDQRVVRAYEAGSIAELRKWVVRNRHLSAAIVVAVVLLTLGLAASLLLGARAERRGKDVLRLAALRDIDRLVAKADELWPLGQDKEEPFRQWIAEAEQLVRELPIHRAELERRATEDSRESRWWAEELRKLVGALESLQTGLLSADAVVPGHGWSVPKRKAFVERLVAGFAAGGEIARVWNEALPAIRQSYGFALPMQHGLVPIGPDPASGLWEFCHLESGAIPARGSDGRLQLDEATGLVLVLVPGGEFVMGAQARDPEGQNYVPGSAASDGPPHEVYLSPYFLSKFEMTQAQWKRITGSNPSYFKGRDWMPGNTWLSLLNPVDTVSWIDALATLERLGLSLPSEAQWQFGARAGTSTMWWTGAEPRDLAKAANLGDLSLQRAGGAIVQYEPWEDGFGPPAACGSLAPNAFGLHDTIGNVSEWCLDGFDAYFYPRSPFVDPVSAPATARLRVLCGGSFLSSAVGARVYQRGSSTPEDKTGGIGVRPARTVEGLAMMTTPPTRPSRTTRIDGFTLVQGREPDAAAEFRARLSPGWLEEDFQAFAPGAPVSALRLGPVAIDVNLLDRDGNPTGEACVFTSPAFAIPGVMLDPALLSRSQLQGADGALEFIFDPPVSAFGAWIFDDFFDSDEFTFEATEADGAVHRAGPLQLNPNTGVEGFVGFESSVGVRRIVVDCGSTFELDHLVIGAAVR